MPEAEHSDTTAGAAADKPTLLIVDDDELIQTALTAFFEEHFQVVCAAHLQDAKSALLQLPQAPQYALVDLGLPPTPHQPTQGFQVLSILQTQAPACAVVVVSGQDARLHGQRARALGAGDYAEKPCDPQTLLKKLQQARQAKLLAQGQHGLVGNSPLLARLREQIALIAPVAFPVLIEGESGVGKELVARALHDAARRGRPFLALNCAALPEHLVEPMLFGHVKGAYTGATRDSAGYLGDAADGTLLLDEVGELPPAVQPKLLRVLETGEYQRVGETRPHQCAARILAASNRSQQRGGSGGMRDDLYYRLNVFNIAVPPLRQLGEDRFVLLEHFRRAIAEDVSAAPFALDEAAMAAWGAYSFPGNVRELKNIIARLQVKFGGQEVTAAQLSEELCGEQHTSPAAGVGEVGDLPPSLLKSGQLGGEVQVAAQRIAVQAARAALAANGGDVTRAAHALHTDPRLLQRLLQLPD